MRLSKYEDDTVPVSSLYKRLRKLYLVHTGQIHCGYCRYHRGENRTHTSPHADNRKKHVKWKFRRITWKSELFGQY